MNKIIRWLKNNEYAAVVFITGAAILIVEVTATRILSPYYGNTIYTVSSVIGVVLGALSLGYWKGGKQADEKPFAREFYGIIFKSGVSLLILFGIVILVLPVGGYFFGLSTGPLVWSMILFFPPSYLMGMLSPYAITLSEKQNRSKGLGHIAGAIFFWSTTGSIAGSLLTGFIFIPHFGVKAIMFGTTLVILLLGSIGLMHTKKEKGGTQYINLIFLLIVLLILYVGAHVILNPSVRYSRDGTYEQITIIDQPYAGKPARFFLQDRSTSGAMFLNSDELAVDYTKYYSVYKLFAENMSRVDVIGGGAYSIPKAIHSDWPGAIIDVSEIEPELENLAKEYFRLPATDKIITHTADGRRFLHDTKNQYDMIFSDVYYSLSSIPPHFTTKEFFQEAKNRLRPNGLLILNVIGTTDPQKGGFLYSEIRTMKTVFPNMSVYAVTATTSSNMQNFILVGINGYQTMGDLPHHLSETDKKFLSNLPVHKLQLNDQFLNQYVVLTDNYSPVEYLISKTMGMLDAHSSKKEERSITQYKDEFPEREAIGHIHSIVGMGSRAIKTKGHEELKNYIRNNMLRLKIKTEGQNWVEDKEGSTLSFANIIARINPNAVRRIIIGTHYDSIARAYRDKDNPNGYMPGANNGASGVALLLSATPALEKMVASSTLGIDLVFFDGEEGYGSLGDGEEKWFPIGSSYFAMTIQQLYPKELPEEVIIVDMVCDRDLSMYKEKTSSSFAPDAVENFWQIGKIFSSRGFRDEVKYSIGDDHFPFINIGIPAFLVIDYEYEPWYNTIQDTPDKCSAESLDAVGNTLLTYVREKI